MSRPEHSAPPEIFYNEQEAQKYTQNSRMIEIQKKMSERAYELLALNPNEGSKLILDIGCGSGLSGEILEDYGHFWIGVDISRSMLDIALERGAEGDLFLADMGEGMFFRPGAFDGAISISALQWLCNADKSNHEPRKRLAIFFTSLFKCMARGARAVFQFYPENSSQLEMITNAALKCGFSGGVVVDFPNSTRAKKYFLCLFAGCPPGGYQLPKALDESEMAEKNTISFEADRKRGKKGKKQKESAKRKDWILKKKESRKRKGLDVPFDSKYTGRKRRSKAT